MISYLRDEVLNAHCHENLNSCKMFEVLRVRRGIWIGVFQNMKRFDARKHITEQLAALGLLRGKQDHTMRVPFCSRSGDVVELLLKPQWWVLVNMSVGCPHVAFHPNNVVLLHCWQILMTRDSVNVGCRLGLILFLTYFDLFCLVKLNSMLWISVV